MKFQVRQLDAWCTGDSDFCWDINTAWPIFTFQTRAKNERKEFTRQLAKHGIIFKKNRTLIDFDGDNYTIIDRKTKEPLFDCIALWN